MSANARESDDDDSQSSTDSESTQTTRPNRWQGHPSTWRALTQDDRAIATSLTTARDRDLSVHLFNAHALKRRTSEIEVKKQDGKGVSEIEDTKGFVPPKSWVAWPLSAVDVPRLREEAEAEDDGLEAFTLKKRERVGGSAELEDVLCAIALKFAKEKFRTRTSDEQETLKDGDGFHKAAMVAEALEEQRRSESEEQFPDRSSGLSDVDAGDVHSHTQKKRSKIKQQKVVKEYIPVISIDDDRSRNILLPSIRHTLSKVDDVLMALHHARETCLQVAKGDTDAESDGVSVITTPEKKSKGRPRKNVDPSDDLPKARKSNAGRRKKEYPRIPGETEPEYLVRIARLQKKPLPSFAPLPQGTPRLSVSERSSRSMTPNPPKASVEDTLDSRTKKLGLRDWSEVLGAASVAGFNPRVIERATQRCAAMFGESMSMRLLVEAPYDNPKDSVRIYQPEIIPNFNSDEFSDGIESDSSDGSPAQSSPPRAIENRQLKAWFCSYQDCPRHEEPFPHLSRLRRHFRQAHKVEYQPSTNEDSLTDEEVDGAVHVDGYLRPLDFNLKSAVPGPRARRTRSHTATKFAQRSDHTRPGSDREELADSFSDAGIDGHSGGNGLEDSDSG